MAGPALPARRTATTETARGVRSARAFIQRCALADSGVRTKVPSSPGSVVRVHGASVLVPPVDGLPIRQVRARVKADDRARLPERRVDFGPEVETKGLEPEPWCQLGQVARRPRLEPRQRRERWSVGWVRRRLESRRSLRSVGSELALHHCLGHRPSPEVPAVRATSAKAWRISYSPGQGVLGELDDLAERPAGFSGE